MEFAACQHDDASLERYAALMHACFPGAAAKFSVGYLRWLYAANPDGPVIGFDAFEGDRLAAHYACIPATALIEGVESRVMLSLNTATHPAFQGKGLFTQLAQKTYDRAAADGVSAAYGVANANSTPGFTRKLGFQLASPLQARIGIGSLGLSRPADASAIGFMRTRSAAAWAWRLSNPNNAVAVRARASGDVQCFAKAAGAVVYAYDEVEASPALLAATPVSRAPSALRLFLGLVPGRRISSAYVPIPDRLRPSPLNLIYKPLAGTVARIDPANVRIGFLDFDAY